MSNVVMCSECSVKEIEVEARDFTNTTLDDICSWLRDLVKRNERDVKLNGQALYPHADVALAVLESLRIPEGSMTTAYIDDGNENIICEEMERVYTEEEREVDLSLI